MDTGLMDADFVAFPDDDLRCDISTLFDTYYRREE
jgi:hypothetical protein